MDAVIPPAGKMVNAWILLAEDWPANTTYHDQDSCYQALVRNNVYASVDHLFLCFFEIVEIGPGNFSIAIQNAKHGDYTNQQYMNWVIGDARANKKIRISATLDYNQKITIDDLFEYPNAVQKFTDNVAFYVKQHKLDGFDIDYESPLSDTEKDHMSYLLNSLRVSYAKVGLNLDLTLSPNTSKNLDAAVVNKTVDFISLQTYYGQSISFDGFNNLGFGAGWEDGYTAQWVYDKNQEPQFRYPFFTGWRLNSSNFDFEQKQQQDLYAMVHRP